MQSLLLNWNIQTRYLAMLIYFLIVLTIDNVFVLLFLLILMILAILGPNLLPSKVLFKRFIKFCPFPIMIFITLLISGITVNFYEYYQFALVVVLRLIIGFLVVQLLVLNGQFIDFIDGLNAVKFPSKLCVIMYLMNRYIPLFYADFKNIKHVLRSRFFISKTNIYSLALWAGVLGNLIVRSYDKSDHIYMAMKSRGVNEMQFNLRRGTIKRIAVADIMLSVFIICLAIIAKLWSIKL